MSFNLPSEDYWNNSDKITELRDIENSISSYNNWTNYKLVLFLYENGTEFAQSIIHQFVFKKGNLSEIQCNSLIDMLTVPMLYVTNDYRVKRQQENKYISIQPTKAERKRIEKNNAEFGN